MYDLMPRTAVGGTFEYLHDGHRRLLHKAFDIAENDIVDIGLTSDTMARQKRAVMPEYTERLKKLEAYLDSLGIKRDAYRIRKLEDAYGTTLEGEYKYIVVSPETLSVAVRINEIRKEKSLEPIEIVKIDYVLADDEIPISSTRIGKGEIDIHGRLKGTGF
jgi:pantetheine-phosphate adenylyltransferase